MRPSPMRDTARGARVHLREEVRNLILRRVDWRFLLSAPYPQRSICFADGSLAEGVAIISDCVADGRLQRPQGDCDLAVAVNPDPATLRAAWTALRPGGLCYTEWYSLWARRPGRVRKRLITAGFERVLCYWPRPSPVHIPSAIWVPLDSSSAGWHVLASRPAPRTVVERVRLLAGRVRWFLSRWLPVAHPLCAVARKPEAATLTAFRRARSGGSDRPAPHPTHELLDLIRRRWDEWALGPRPGHLSWALLTGGRRSKNKVVALVFADGEAQPKLAIKMPRIPESVAQLAVEADALRALQSRPGGIQGIPRLLFSHRHAGILAVGETALTGVAMYGLLTPESVRAFARQATAWLVALAGAPRLAPPAVWRRRLVEPLLADFESFFGPVLDPGLLRAQRQALETLGPLPLVCEHRDFTPGNALITADGSLAVLDWERAELDGLPALDLIKFLTYAGFALDGAWNSGHFQESYRATRNPSTLTGDVSAECLARYADALGLRRSQLRPLRLLLWLIKCRREYESMVADIGGTPDQEALRRSVFLGLWEEEMRCSRQPPD